MTKIEAIVSWISETVPEVIIWPQLPGNGIYFIYKHQSDGMIKNLVMIIIADPDTSTWGFKPGYYTIEGGAWDNHKQLNLNDPKSLQELAQVIKAQLKRYV
jgi:hypothetical protein